jgi:group I intron endonuclease
MQTENSPTTPYGYVYKITNKTNGECYIGQTTNLPKYRFNTYHGLKCIKQPKLYNALKKYGPDNFTYESIDTTAIDQTTLNNLEIHYILQCDSMNNGYNCDPGGHGRGKRLSEETRHKLSMAAIGRKRSKESIEKSALGIRGRERSEETRRKISESNKGKKHSEETRHKLSLIFTGRKLSKEHIEKSALGHIGHIVSEETRRKISEALKNREWTEENKQAHLKAHKGRKLSEESKRKISEFGRGHIVSEETRRKISIARKGKPCKPFTDEHRRKIAETKLRKRLERFRNSLIVK